MYTLKDIPNKTCNMNINIMLIFVFMTDLNTKMHSHLTEDSDNSLLNFGNAHFFQLIKHYSSFFNSSMT